MNFNSPEHESRFNILRKRSDCSFSDRSRIALFFIISGVSDLYNNVNEIYDFETNMLKLDFDDIGEPNLSELYLCSSANALLRLAIQLYNGIGLQSVANTFKNLDSDNVYLAINSLNIRYK